MTQPDIQEAVIKLAGNFARELQKRGIDLSDGAVMLLDPRLQPSADFVVGGLMQQGMTEEQARNELARGVMRAESDGSFPLVHVWYATADLRTLLSEIGVNVQQLNAWLSAPPPPTGGFVRVVLISGKTVSFAVAPYMRAGIA